MPASGTESTVWITSPQCLVGVNSVLALFLSTQFALWGIARVLFYLRKSKLCLLEGSKAFEYTSEGLPQFQWSRFAISRNLLITQCARSPPSMKISSGFNLKTFASPICRFGSGFQCQPSSQSPPNPCTCSLVGPHSFLHFSPQQHYPAHSKSDALCSFCRFG
jgi:hypothetical protein